MPSNLVNRLLDWLTNNYRLKFLIPGTRYCGPQFDSEELIRRGVVPLSPVDELCQAHDKAYIAHSDLEHRKRADQELINSLQRLLASNTLTTYQGLIAKVILGLMSTKRFVGGNPSTKERIQTGSFPPLAVLLPLIASGLTAINQARNLLRGKGRSPRVKRVSQPVGRGRQQPNSQSSHLPAITTGGGRKAKRVVSKKKKRRTTSKNTLKIRQF